MSETRVGPGCPHSVASHDFQPFKHPGTYEFFARARVEAPVFYSQELDYWVLTRHRDIKAVFSDPQTYSADVALQPIQPFPPELLAYLRAVGFAPEKVHPDCDPPKHARIRRIAAQYLNVKVYNSFEHGIRQLAKGYIDRLHGEDTVDIVDRVLYEFPAQVIFLLLGEAAIEPRQLKSWGTNRLAMVWGRLSADEAVKGGRSLADFWNFTGDIVRTRMATPGDDYPSFLLAQRNGDDDILSMGEIQSMLFALLFAGHETTTNAAGNLLVELLQERATWEGIVRDPSRIPNAVEEGLRKASSVVAWRRRTTRSVQIGGVSIPENANILLALGSANHDEAVFENPGRFDVARSNARQHLSFGYGEHFCMGGPLARIELRILLEELTRSFPDMELVQGQTFDWIQTLSFRGPEKLLVKLAPAAA